MVRLPTYPIFLQIGLFIIRKSSHHQRHQRQQKLARLFMSSSTRSSSNLIPMMPRLGNISMSFRSISVLNSNLNQLKKSLNRRLSNISKNINLGKSKSLLMFHSSIYGASQSLIISRFLNLLRLEILSESSIQIWV